MTALSLLNRQLNNRLNNFDRGFNRSFVSPFWLQDLEEASDLTTAYQMKYLDEKSAWQLTFEVAGVTKNNLKVDVKEGHLLLSGEKTKGVELGKFEKHFKIPEGVDLEKIEALFEDGVLTVDLPLEAKKAPKPVQIK
jgi:HSP20 family protein